VALCFSGDALLTSEQQGGVMNVDELYKLIYNLEEVEEPKRKSLNDAEKSILSELDTKLLLKKDFYQHYILDVVISKGSLEFIKSIFAHVPKLPNRNEFYETLIYSNDAEERIIDVLNIFEELGFLIKAEKYSLMIKKMGSACKQYRNCYDLCFVTIKYLLSKGGEIDFTGKSNKDSSLLMEVSSYGDARSVCHLIKLGADPKKKLADGSTALTFAAGKQLPDLTTYNFNYDGRLEVMYFLNNSIDVPYEKETVKKALYFAKKLRNMLKEYDSYFDDDMVDRLSKKT